jgi:hypothetical protein
MYNFRHNFLFKLRIAKIQNAKIEGASHILHLSLSRGHAALIPASRPNPLKARLEGNQNISTSESTSRYVED